MSARVEMLQTLARMAIELGEIARLALELEGERAEDSQRADGDSAPSNRRPPPDIHPQRRLSDSANATRMRARRAAARSAARSVHDLHEQVHACTSVQTDRAPLSDSPSLSQGSEIAENVREISLSGNARADARTVHEQVHACTSVQTDRAQPIVQLAVQPTEPVPMAMAIRPPRPTLAPTQRLIDPDLKLSDEARAMAELGGVQDVPAAWAKFAGKMKSKGVLSCDFIGGEWRAWIPTAAKYERIDRERERSANRQTGVRAARLVQPPAAPGESTWKVGGDE